MCTHVHIHTHTQSFHLCQAENLRVNEPICFHLNMKAGEVNLMDMLERTQSCKLEKHQDGFVTSLVINDVCAIKQKQPSGREYLSALYFYL